MRVLKGTKLKNGFLWIPIHFTHDPDKSSWEWQDNARRSFPRPSDFEKELEIDFGLHVGAPAYPRFAEAKHVGPTIYDTRRPLCLAFDFNVNPMSLVVSQIWREKRIIMTLKEFVYGPTTIDSIVADFRGSYPAHQSDILLYGDATRGTTAQTAKTNWDIVELGFRGYHIPPVKKLPLSNPHIGDRLNATNYILSGSAQYTIVIDPSCVELLRDLREVILTSDGKKIFKENDPDNPYYLRTHASDAWTYMLFFEFPMVSEIMREFGKKRLPIQPGRLLGEVDAGVKAELERAKGLGKRPPLDRSGSR